MVGRDLETHPVPAPAACRQLRLPGPEHLQCLGSSASLPRAKHFLLISCLISLSFCLMPFPLVLSQSDCVKSYFPSCSSAPFKYWKAAMRLCLLHVEQAQLPQTSFIAEVFQPLSILVASSEPIKQLRVFLVLGEGQLGFNWNYFLQYFSKSRHLCLTETSWIPRGDEWKLCSSPSSLS